MVKAKQENHRSVWGISPKLWHRVRVAAANESVTLGEFVSKALEHELNFEEVASEWARRMGWTEPR